MLHLLPEHRAESTVVRVSGTLDAAVAPELRDGVLKVATDAPERLIVDIGDLDVPDPASLTVFTVIALRMGDWPGIPFLLVTPRPDHLAALTARSVTRFVPVHSDIAAAERAHERPRRRRADRQLAASPQASALARDFVEDVCAHWDVPRYLDDALLIATELVENVIRHTASPPRLSLELRHDRFAVAVADDDPRPAVLLERLSVLEPGLGLRMVARTARIWGCSRSWRSGKVVWALLKS